MLRTYDGAVVLMTGGASGIGKSMAVELVRRGAELVIADRDIELARETSEMLGPKARAVELDVTDFDRFQRVVDEVFENSGRLDYLFNNAGISISGEVKLKTIDAWNRVLDVNIRGVVHGVQAAYAKMVEQGFGHIVNTASMAGLLPGPGIVSYGASKHAVVGLSKGLRVEAAAYGVRVTALCPGFIRTPILTGGKYGGTVDTVPVEEQAAGVERLRPMNPDLFARKTIDALAGNPAYVVFPRWYRLFWWINRLSPDLGLAMSTRMLADMKRRRQS